VATSVISNSELDGIFKANNGISYYAGLRAVWLAGYQTGTTVTLSLDTSSTGITQTPIDAVPLITTL
jgi:hypothetical protein